MKATNGGALPPTSHSREGDKRQAGEGLSFTSHSRESGNPGLEWKAAAAPGMAESMTPAEKTAITKIAITKTRAGTTETSAFSPDFPLPQSPASILDSRFRGNDLYGGVRGALPEDLHKFCVGICQQLLARNAL